MRFKDRVKAIMHTQKLMHTIILGNGYFILRFENSLDLKYAHFEGPWTIFDNYILLQKWVPCFNPYKHHDLRIAVWFRYLLYQ